MSICKEEKFKRIFLEYNPRIQRYLQTRGMEKEEASDAAQDVFTKLWKNCAKVLESTVMSYLFKMANNIRIDVARKQNVKLKYTKATTTHDRQNIDPQYLLEIKEFKQKLEDTLSSMNENSKVVFMMSRFDDMSYKEIAESLEISVKAVEKRMSKAIAHLIDHEILKRK